MDILIIEDHPVDRKLFQTVLRDYGHVVREEVTAEEALESIAKNRPELILLDLRLPQMSGVTLLKMLKSKPETADIPVVVITAYPHQFSKKDMIAAGCVDYWIKPIDTRTMPKKVAELVIGSKKE